jgi:hypothetical protein
MRYCQDCGTPHECTAEGEREADKTRIRLAEIEASRDVRIAELRAGEVKTEAAAAIDIAEAEMAVDAARAEGEADGMETVIDAAAGGNDPAGAEPVVAEFPGGESGDPEPEPEETQAPPETELVPATPKKAGWWDAYQR